MVFQNLLPRQFLQPLSKPSSYELLTPYIYQQLAQRDLSTSFVSFFTDCNNSTATHVTSSAPEISSESISQSRSESTVIASATSESTIVTEATGATIVMPTTSQTGTINKINKPKPSLLPPSVPNLKDFMINTMNGGKAYQQQADAAAVAAANTATPNTQDIVKSQRGSIRVNNTTHSHSHSHSHSPTAVAVDENSIPYISSQQVSGVGRKGMSFSNGFSGGKWNIYFKFD